MIDAMFSPLLRMGVKAEIAKSQEMAAEKETAAAAASTAAAKDSKPEAAPEPQGLEAELRALPRAEQACW